MLETVLASAQNTSSIDSRIVLIVIAVVALIVLIWRIDNKRKKKYYQRLVSQPQYAKQELQQCFNRLQHTNTQLAVGYVERYENNYDPEQYYNISDREIGSLESEKDNLHRDINTIVRSLQESRAIKNTRELDSLTVRGATMDGLMVDIHTLKNDVENVRDLSYYGINNQQINRFRRY